MTVGLTTPSTSFTSDGGDPTSPNQEKQKPRDRRLCRTGCHPSPRESWFAFYIKQQMNCGELDALGSVEVVESTSVYPTGLQNIIDLFVSLPDEEKRETLISYAEQTGKWRPREGESFDLEDIRKDEECADTVGVFLKVSDGNKVRFRITLGPQVQTLTKAMTSILCRGLEGATLSEILDLPSDFVPKIIGAELVRARSHTVYYVLTRMKGICTVFRNRKRAEEA